MPEQVLQASAARNAITQAHGAEPILSLGHLAHLSGAPYLYLRQIVQRTRDPYGDISRQKKTGGIRLISAPEPVLMDVQRLILRRALRNLPLHPFCYAYREGRTIQACAQQHLGAKWMIKFDLHNFFGQIEERDVYRVFDSCGYSALVSFELARICTRSRVADFHSRSGRYSAITTYDVDVTGRLPQGAPTSGALSNAVATPLDYTLHEFATGAGFVYTRYSDDMVLSTCQDFNRAQAVTIIREVSHLVATHRFRLHRKKTRVIPPGARHVVLGLLVDGGEVRLTPEFRRRVEVHIRGVREFGLSEHSDHRKFRSLLSFINHVEGSLAFARSIQPAWADEKRAEWRSILGSLGLTL
ncbi:reverse transcriptase family protein [Mycolicibacterium grossiae]|nr:reverse transcriptase family protein [Mycolicibacterium grossiae]